MAIPTQGGLGQASAVQAKPPAQAGGRFDVNAAQAENIEEITKSKPTGLKETIVDDLGDQREAMNAALLRMRSSLDERKNRLFDPVLMQTAAGFLKPTKTGSFGESLGYAAEGAGAAAERQLLTDRENQKLEMELLAKEQELRQQMGGDQLISAMLGGPRTNAPAPAGGAVTTPTGQLRVPGTTSPVDVTTTSNPQQILMAAAQGRIKVTDEILLLANRVAKNMLPTLQEIRKSQSEEEKNRIEREKLDFQRSSEKRKTIPRGLRTEREMDAGEYKTYRTALDDYFKTGDENRLLDFYDRMGWLESEQVRGRKIDSKPAEGTTAVLSPVPRAKSQSEMEAEKETATQTAKGRAESAEKMASRLGLQAEAAFENTNTAQDMIGYAKNNPLVFEIMNRPGLKGAILRAVQEGVNVNNFNINLPAATIAQYELSANDLTALQMFMQKSAQLQSRGRQLNRTPGEGATSDYETKLLGGIYALPSDSQRAIILKSDALILQGKFDEERFKLWNQKSKQSGYTYNDFLVDDDYKTLKADYRKTLDRVREDNLDLLSTKKPAAPSAAPPKPAATPAPTPAPEPAPAPSSQAPKNETYSERLKRLQKEREKQKSGG